MMQWGASMLFSCFGVTTTEGDPNIEIRFKANLLNYSAEPYYKGIEQNILYQIEKMMETSSYYDIDCVIKELKNLNITNIWLYTEKRKDANQVILLPNSNFSKKHAIRVFFGTKEDFMRSIAPVTMSENLNLLREAGFCWIK